MGDIPTRSEIYKCRRIYTIIVKMSILIKFAAKGIHTGILDKLETILQEHLKKPAAGLIFHSEISALQI